jgi:hypothetical protein
VAVVTYHGFRRWYQQLNQYIDAVVSETLKLEEKQSIYRKLGFIYTKEVLWLFAAAPFVKLRPRCGHAVF